MATQTPTGTDVQLHPRCQLPGQTSAAHAADAAIVASALFMQNLDASVVSTALPAIARDLGQVPGKAPSRG